MTQTTLPEGMDFPLEGVRVLDLSRVFAGPLCGQVLTELCLTGERISGERMAQLGVVNRLAEPGQAIVHALALAQQVAQGPELAMARIKHLCREAPRNTLEQQLELEAQYMVQSQESAESREGIAAFLEKRSPQFRQPASVPLTE